jgi:hypothetical protein
MDQDQEQNYKDLVVFFLQTLNDYLQGGICNATPKQVMKATSNGLGGSWADTSIRERDAQSRYATSHFERSYGTELIQLFQKKLDSGHMLNDLVTQALEKAKISPVPPENVTAIVEAIELDL